MLQIATLPFENIRMTRAWRFEPSKKDTVSPFTFTTESTAVTCIKQQWDLQHLTSSDDLYPHMVRNQINYSGMLPGKQANTSENNTLLVKHFSLDDHFGRKFRKIALDKIIFIV